MVSVPATWPVTTPVAEPIVASVVLLLLHVPPVEALNRAVVNPVHTFVIPVIAAGNGFTVSIAVAMQPVGSV